MIWLIQSTKLFKIEEIMISLKGGKKSIQGSCVVAKECLQTQCAATVQLLCQEPEGRKTAANASVCLRFEPQCPRFPSTPGYYCEKGYSLL